MKGFEMTPEEEHQDMMYCLKEGTKVILGVVAIYSVIITALYWIAKWYLM